MHKKPYLRYPLKFVKKGYSPKITNTVNYYRNADDGIIRMFHPRR
jgi:hypothetical protein